MIGMAALVAVSIGYSSYTPPQLDVVRGETVRWTQESVRDHTVTARDATWDSGVLRNGDTFERTFTADGEVPYYCRLHSGITGVVDVHEVVLDPVEQAAGKGRAFPLTGRAADGVKTVTVSGDDGSQTTASVADDGTFTASVTPATTTTYTAADSPPVTLRVLDRKVTVHRNGPRSVTAVVSPASPGAVVVLQLRLPAHFGWWPVTWARLGKDSAATLRPRRASRAPARVVLTLPDRATPLAFSPRFSLLGPPARPGRAGTSAPGPAGHHGRSARSARP